jgi:signal transduction histidine kinase
LGDGISFVIVAEEAMRTSDLRSVTAWVRAQPPWSDLPFIVLSLRHGGSASHEAAARLSELLGNVTLLERPFHPRTFVSVAATAMKGRQRQYEARASIAALRESEERLVRLNETLEQRVAERTAELERAHAAVVAEMNQREQAEEKLRQAQKMEMIGQLTGGVAHDFNNLLMAVVGNLALLRKHSIADAKAIRLIDGALQGAQRGASLTQRLLAFARRQDLKIEPVDTVQLVRGMSELMERSIGKEIELVLDLAAKLPPVLVDANQIELALLNLVINARDAMAEGGSLDVRVDERSGDTQSGLPHASYVRFVVEDSGCGMDATTLARATEPFFSTKELGKGTGLGLSMVHGLAVQLGGTLRLSSQVGVGTRAELWLPVTTQAVEHPLSESAIVDVDGVGRLTVLVVDDDALIAMSTVSMVEDLGHDVIEAHSASRALEILSNGSSIDLMITDFSMPKMNGAQLAKAARELRPDLPIVLATGYAELPSGFDEDLPKISKPYQQDQLAVAISSALRMRTHGIAGDLQPELGRGCLP